MPIGQSAFPPQDKHSTRSYYNVQVPPEVLTARHDHRYRAKPMASKTAFEAHQYRKTGYMSARDIPSNAFMDGLSLISASGSVASLMSEDDEQLRSVFDEFVTHLEEDSTEKEGGGKDGPPSSPKGKDTAAAEQRQSVADWQRKSLAAVEKARKSSARPSVASTTHLGPGTTKDDDDKTTETSSIAEAPSSIEDILDAQRASLRYRLVPWRCVFQSWVRALTNELVRSRASGYSTNYITPLEVFMRRARDACVVPTVSDQGRDIPGADPGSPPESGRSSTVTSTRVRRRRHRYPGSGGSTDTEALQPMIMYNHRHPHILSIASALYLFDVYLIPAFDNEIYQQQARQAFHELVLAIFSEGPPGRENTMGSTTRTAAPDDEVSLLTHHHEANVYVRPTFSQRFHELKAMYVELRESNRKQNLVMERQEHILNKTLLRWKKQTAKRLLAAWYAYTQRVKKLRLQYKKIFLSLSDTAVVAVRLRKWKTITKSVLAQHRSEEAQQERRRPEGKEGEDGTSPVVSSAHLEYMQRRNELTALVQQRQFKLTIIEDSAKTVRRLQAKRSELESRHTAVKERTVKIGNLWTTLIDDLMPHFERYGAVYADGPGNTGGGYSMVERVSCFETHKQLLSELVMWIVELSERDSALASQNLPHIFMAYPNLPLNFSSVLARSTHLFPLMRAALTVVQPPPSWASTAMLNLEGPAADTVPPAPSVGTQGFVAFGEGRAASKSPTSDRASPENVLETIGSGTLGRTQEIIEDEDLGGSTAELIAELTTDYKPPEALGTSSLATKHLALSVALKADLEEVESELEKEEQQQLSGSRKEPSSPLSPKIRSPLTKSARFPGMAEEEVEEARKFERRKSSLRIVQARSLHQLKQTASNRKLSLFHLKKENSVNSSMHKIQREESGKGGGLGSATATVLDALPPDRSKQLEPVLRPLSSIGDTSGFATFALSLLNKISRASGVPFLRVLPNTHAQRLCRPAEDWRTIMLSYLYLTQVGNNSGSFKLLPSKLEKETKFPSSVPKEPAVDGSLRVIGRHSSRAPGSLRKPTTEAPAEPQFDNAGQLKALWEERSRKRRFGGEDAKAARSNRLHEESIARLADAALSGGEITRECTRLFQLLCAASPITSNTTVVTSEFLAKKLRIVFPDKTSWRQANVNRRLYSGRDMEEYLKTMSVATQMSVLELCDRLTAAVDDTDHFYASIGSREVQLAFESTLTDLTIIFSLYSMGEVPHHYVTLDGWLQLVQPFLDVSFTKPVATEAYQRMHQRNCTFRVEGGDSLSLNDVQLQRVAGGRATSFSQSLALSGGGKELIEVELPGLNMDAFCQALCVVIPFKMPNPMIPLEAKIPLFVENWLVPMAGTKVKPKGAAAVAASGAGGGGGSSGRPGSADDPFVPVMLPGQSLL